MNLRCIIKIIIIIVSTKYYNTNVQYYQRRENLVCSTAMCKSSIQMLYDTEVIEKTTLCHPMKIPHSYKVRDGQRKAKIQPLLGKTNRPGSTKKTKKGTKGSYHTA
ncbi:hypothetical protein DM860_011873 [Cuscuta australis]|uniref:Uncharacterized protein n=1 Tax=Cuscuta australis TaxID=267555 RepID=A0A328DA93_9ASTE|nr:hypothetical protein DM860_011873 [Cuscuta australis]